MDLLLLAGFEVVVAEHGDDGQPARRVELADEQLRLLGKAEVGQIAAEHQHVGAFARGFEEWPEGPFRRPRAVQVRNSSYAHEEVPSNRGAAASARRAKAPRRRLQEAVRLASSSRSAAIACRASSRQRSPSSAKPSTSYCNGPGCGGRRKS